MKITTLKTTATAKTATRKKMTEIDDLTDQMRQDPYVPFTMKNNDNDKHAPQTTTTTETPSTKTKTTQQQQ